jgi:predicted nucleic acid-binding Zn ribbon protein
MYVALLFGLAVLAVQSVEAKLDALDKSRVAIKARERELKATREADDQKAKVIVAQDHELVEKSRADAENAKRIKAFEELEAHEAAARHVQPVKLDGERLVVEVDDPAWATQLRFLERTLIDRLAEVTGAVVASFEIRVGRPR